MQINILVIILTLILFYYLKSKIKAMGKDFDALKAQIDAQNSKIDETNASITGIAADVKSLKEKIDGGIDGGLNSDEVAELSALVSGVSTRLENLAASAKSLDDETIEDAPAPTPEPPADENV